MSDLTTKRPLAGRVLWLVALAFVACVPATDESLPRGAINVVFTPGAAARGEPFVTADGWTVRVETLVLQVTARAQSPAATSYKGAGFAFFRARDPASIMVTGIRAGAATVSVVFTARPVGPRFEIDNSVKRDLEKALITRFARTADNGLGSTGGDAGEDAGDDLASGSLIGTGPSLVLVAQGTKDGRTVRLDVALQVLGASLEVPVVVEANALRPVGVAIVAETFFRSSVLAPLAFDDLAAADTNSDGTLSIEELKAAEQPCDLCSGDAKAPVALEHPSMLSALAKRAHDLFMVP